MYKITIQFKDISSKDKSIEAISHAVIESQLLSIIAVDKKRYFFPLSNIICVEFDERFGEILSIRKDQLNA